MAKILRNLEDVKADAIERLRRNADRAKQKGDLTRAQRFKEGSDYLESEHKPTWARRPSERGQ